MVDGRVRLQKQTSSWCFCTQRHKEPTVSAVGSLCTELLVAEARSKNTHQPGYTGGEDILRSKRRTAGESRSWAHGVPRRE
jgi:hypothetical protein